MEMIAAKESIARSPRYARISAQRRRSFGLRWHWIEDLEPCASVMADAAPWLFVETLDFWDATAVVRSAGALARAGNDLITPSPS